MCYIVFFFIEEKKKAAKTKVRRKKEFCNGYFSFSLICMDSQERVFLKWEV
jgi:hypothetical protein